MKCLVIILALLISSHGEELSSFTAKSFIKQCLKVKEVHDNSILPPPSVHISPSNDINVKKCITFKCFLRNYYRDLRHLKNLECSSDGDCFPDVTAMICRSFPLSGGSGNSGFCDCPRGQAYDPLSCRCEEAEQCGNDQVNCHKGMKCSDRSCICDEFSRKLIEPHSQFCVERKTTNTANHFTSEESNDGTSGFQIAIIVLSCLISCAIVVLGLSMAAGTLRSFCDTGDYICDEDAKDRQAKSRGTVAGQPRFGNSTNVHVAAWDLPGLDYLSEEQTMKYLNRGQSFSEDSSPPMETSTPNGRPLRRAGAKENISHASSPSPSSGGGSLPESDRFDVEGKPGISSRPSLLSVHSSTVQSNVL